MAICQAKDRTDRLHIKTLLWSLYFIHTTNKGPMIVCGQKDVSDDL